MQNCTFDVFKCHHCQIIQIYIFQKSNAILCNCRHIEMREGERDQETTLLMYIWMPYTVCVCVLLVISLYYFIYLMFELLFGVKSSLQTTACRLLKLLLIFCTVTYFVYHNDVTKCWEREIERDCVISQNELRAPCQFFFSPISHSHSIFSYLFCARKLLGRLFVPPRQNSTSNHQVNVMKKQLKDKINQESNKENRKQFEI